MTEFSMLGLSPTTLKAVADTGYTTATPIQASAIPVALAGRDVLGIAQTGTGKTAAFTLPMIDRLSSGRAKARMPRALVLAPTRELADQVASSFEKYAKGTKLSWALLIGGVSMGDQVTLLNKGVDVLIATPGRLLDLFERGKVMLNGVEIMVVDEADRMLDMGFIHDVKKVLALVPKDKQSLLFSATFSDEIRDLANGLLKNPQSVQVTPRNTTVQRITQLIHPVGRGKKKALLAHIIKEHDWSQVLVFVRTKFGANNVAEYLEKNGITAMALHGNKSQGARTQALAGFKSGDVRALVATDIAARGIDIDELPHVVNYEIPNVSEDYVHRIGRTGRAGSDGAAINLVCLDEEGFMADIERFTKQKIEVKVVEGFAPEPGERAEPIAMGRQTIWGGAGKPPSREVMAAAGKAARTEMLQRVRDNKAGQGDRGRSGQAQGQGQRSGGGQSPSRGGGGGGQARPQGQRAQGPGQGGGQGRNNEQRRSGNAGGNAGARAGEPRQPDPLRTGTDALSERGRNNRGRGRPGGGGGQGRNADTGKSGGGGGVDPLRTNYGRISH
ncbi:MAG: DEAD/DEAH box helicase [Hylemonella sp.]|nr:DEAD/DEAH box helicase [Hylemonella sp.]